MCTGVAEVCSVHAAADEMRRVTRYQREALGRGSPSLHCRQGPVLHHILGLLIHSHHRLLGDPQQPWDQLILTLHLFLSEGDKTSDKNYAGAKHLHAMIHSPCAVRLVLRRYTCCARDSEPCTEEGQL